MQTSDRRTPWTSAFSSYTLVAHMDHYIFINALNRASSDRIQLMSPSSVRTHRRNQCDGMAGPLSPGSVWVAPDQCR